MSRHISHLSNGSWVSKESSTFSARLWTWANMRPPCRQVRSTISNVVRHRLEIVLGRLVGKGALAHDIGAQGTVAHVARVVDALGQRLQHVQELGEGLPAPFDAGLHGGAADVLGAFEIAHDEVGLAL